MPSKNPEISDSRISFKKGNDFWQRSPPDAHKGTNFWQRRIFCRDAVAATWRSSKLPRSKFRFILDYLLLNPQKILDTKHFFSLPHFFSLATWFFSLPQEKKFLCKEKKSRDKKKKFCYYLNQEICISASEKNLLVKFADNKFNDKKIERGTRHFSWQNVVAKARQPLLPLRR